MRVPLTGVVLPDGPPGQGQDVVARHGRGACQGRAQPRPRRGLALGDVVEDERAAGDQHDRESACQHLTDRGDLTAPGGPVVAHPPHRVTTAPATQRAGAHDLGHLPGHGPGRGTQRLRPGQDPQAADIHGPLETQLLAGQDGQQVLALPAGWRGGHLLGEVIRHRCALAGHQEQVGCQEAGGPAGSAVGLGQGDGLARLGEAPHPQPGVDGPGDDGGIHLPGRGHPMRSRMTPRSRRATASAACGEPAWEMTMPPTSASRARVKRSGVAVCRVSSG